ncbi:MAG: hypothetical protein IPK76_27265 [Lewinellaceae bacterium]|nr:hypothetical protein [Lewinellaceae bacterium]
MTDDEKKDLEVRLKLIKEKYALWQKYREAEEYWRARVMALEEFIEPPGGRPPRRRGGGKQANRMRPKKFYPAKQKGWNGLNTTILKTTMDQLVYDTRFVRVGSD